MKELHVSDYCQTLTLPKPLVEFANRPMILHQIESLAAAGVTDIVLAVNYRPDIMAKALKKVRTHASSETFRKSALTIQSMKKSTM